MRNKPKSQRKSGKSGGERQMSERRVKEDLKNRERWKENGWGKKWMARGNK